MNNIGEVGKWGSGKWELKIMNFRFVCSFCRRGYSSVQLQWFCLSGRNGSDAFVRRSVTCGYEGYCLSGKGSLIVEGRRHIVFQNVFWLEKPNFHNRRIYSAA
jgi:hypothetical protein